MSVPIVSGLISSIAGSLFSEANGAISQSEIAKNALQARARYIAGREFMIKLRGDNDQIQNEQLKSLRDGGAQELAKS